MNASLLRVTLTAAPLLLWTASYLAGCGSVASTTLKVSIQEELWDDAVVAGKTALAENPNNAETHFYIGFAYSKLDSVGLAYGHLTRAAELDSTRLHDKAMLAVENNSNRHVIAANQHIKRGEFSRARSDLRIAIKAYPVSAKPWYNLGASYVQEDQHDVALARESIAAFDSALARTAVESDMREDILQILAKRYVRADRVDEMPTRFGPVVAEKPSRFGWFEEQGRTYFDARQFNVAVAFFEIALVGREALGEHDAELFRLMGESYFQLRESRDDALRLSVHSYERALSIKRDDAPSLMGAAYAHIKQAEFQSAARRLESYVNVNPTDQRGWQLLARCYVELGEPEKARATLRSLEKYR